MTMPILRVVLRVGQDLALRRPIVPHRWQAARARGWVKLVISYRIMPPDADAAEFLAEALHGHGVAATAQVEPAPETRS
jgi:hypothetical protein